MKKGFTLVELLAVILVLGIILTITIYSVNSILNDSEESLSEVQENTIIESAKVYYLKEGINLESDPDYDETVCVSVNYLATNGYLDKQEVYDPENYNKIGGYVKITNEYDGSQYTDVYSYEYVSGAITSASINNCSVKVDVSPVAE